MSQAWQLEGTGSNDMLIPSFVNVNLKLIIIRYDD
jgi:hypothetical protein